MLKVAIFIDDDVLVENGCVDHRGAVHLQQERNRAVADPECRPVDAFLDQSSAAKKIRRRRRSEYGHLHLRTRDHPSDAHGWLRRSRETRTN
jgi:hypothetical protein